LHLRDALDLVSKRQPHLIRKFGGHAMAAGLSIGEECLDDFRLAFETIAQELLDTDALVKTIHTDGSLGAEELTLDSARYLQNLVWGQGFPEPLFEGDFRVLSQRLVGEKHIKLKLSSPAGSFDAIRFFSAEPAPDNIHAVYSLSVNEYNGSESLQLIVRHW
jgi:single-stranded-DNA-specific exonuclease